MASPSSHSKTLHLRLHVRSLKSPSSSTQLTSPKLKTVLQTFIFRQLYRIVRALTKAKSILIRVLKEIQILHFIQLSMKKSSNNLKKKLFLGSFRLHYNWGSSHVKFATKPELEGSYYSANHFYNDSSWNAAIPSTDSREELMGGAADSSSPRLSGYLSWLEEKENNNHHHLQGNDIDRLAEMFIANSHEKFRLEKQDSYRRFQEMMERSI